LALANRSCKLNSVMFWFFKFCGLVIFFLFVFISFLTFFVRTFTDMALPFSFVVRRVYGISDDLALAISLTAYAISTHS